ncbi:MAG: ROK family protein, partial [Kiritimatiellae bacterium]|nr:ROK family protein [Kiritimatiellia bacterium]
MQPADNNLLFLTPPRIIPPLDPDFRPAVAARRAFQADVARSGQGVPLVIAVEADNGAISSYQTNVFSEKHKQFASNFPYVERIVKFLLWQRGGWRVVVGGPQAVGQ